MAENQALQRAIDEVVKAGIMTQPQIAKAARLSQQTLYNYLAGKGPTLKNARQLARALGKRLEEIFPENFSEN